MVESLKEDGGGPRMTIFENSGHDIKGEVYSNQDLWQWMFAQRNSKPDLGMIAGVTPEHDRNN
jgi:hypothetical protein